MDERPGWSTSFDEMVKRWNTQTPAEKESNRRRFYHRAEAERLEQERAIRVRDAIRSSDLGPRWENCTLDGFAVPPGDPRALEMARAFVDMIADPNLRGPWFFGPMGLGKTHICAGIVRACAEMGVVSEFKTAQGFLDLLKGSYDRDGKLKYGEVDIIARLSRVPVLVLDDLDKVTFSGWASQKFYSLVNARYSQNRPLLATSNCTPADLVHIWSNGGLDNVIGAAILDRMRQMCRLVPVAGESQRGMIA